MGGEASGRDETRLATGALAALGVLAVPALAVASLVAGTAGVLAVIAALVLVAILFVSGAVLLRLVVGSSPATVITTLVMGLVGRLLAYAAILAGLAQVGGVHRPTLGVTAGVAVAVVLVHELRLLHRMPRLFWIDADAGRPGAASNATRSQTL